MAAKKIGTHFDFGSVADRPKALVHLRKTPGRKLVFTLTDMAGKVIFCSTSGAIGGPKQFRRSPYVVEPMFQRLLHFLRFFKIGVLYIYVKMRVSAHVYAFVEQCRMYGISIAKIVERFGVPHNGVRRRKKPRK
jgi:ribosomal protein S11